MVAPAPGQGMSWVGRWPWQAKTGPMCKLSDISLFNTARSRNSGSCCPPDGVRDLGVNVDSTLALADSVEIQARWKLPALAGTAEHMSAIGKRKFLIE